MENKRKKDYKLIDGIKRNKKHPLTFFIPTIKEKKELNVGDRVKLGFANNNGKCGERMWVKIIKIKGIYFQGELDNRPLNPDFGIQVGSEIDFSFKHIIDIW